MLSLTAFFNVRLAIAERKGYARCVEFQIDPLGTAPPLIPRFSSETLVGKERPASSTKYHPQLHRTNRVGRYLTAEARRLKQESNERYRARRRALRMAQAQLVIVWPTQES